MKTESKEPDDAGDSATILNSLHFTHFWLTDKYKAILAKYGITVQQFNVLMAVARLHPKSITVTELKTRLPEKNADVSRVVTRLTDKKLLKRTVNLQNRRKVEITMTEKGCKLVERIQQEQPYKKFTSAFSVDEVTLFTSLLKKLRVP
ncbi:MAG: MarR family transcriptional regulator [Bacteroidota bacterium]